MSIYTKARKHLEKVDPVLFEALTKIGDPDLPTKRVPSEYFQALCNEIIAQQLSGKVADVIFGRFLSLFLNQEVTPKAILNLTHDQLRGVGMSNSKASFLHDLAQKVETRQLELAKLSGLTNQEVLTHLTKVKGIGPWTAEMFLMFTLGRSDLFSLGDQGLKNAIKRLYNLETTTPEVLTTISSKWSPYRTYACLILWKSLDNR